MHKSQLGGLIIDCQTDDLEAAATFWSAALGMTAISDPRSDNTIYRRLESRPGELEMEVQKVSHESRVHLDIETDDIEAEVSRLEKLGARQVENVHSWVVMEAPTGQRFCVVKSQTRGFDESANSWG